jgi:hypothetical protein
MATEAAGKKYGWQAFLVFNPDAVINTQLTRLKDAAPTLKVKSAVVIFSKASVKEDTTGIDTSIEDQDLDMVLERWKKRVATTKSPAGFIS